MKYPIFKQFNNILLFLSNFRSQNETYSVSLSELKVQHSKFIMFVCLSESSSAFIDVFLLVLVVHTYKVNLCYPY